MNEEDRKAASVKGGEIGGKIVGRMMVESGQLASVCSKGGKVSASLTYISTATGFVSNASAVTRHNKSLGHPKDAKARIPDEMIDRFVRAGHYSNTSKAQKPEVDKLNAKNLEIYLEFVA